MGHLHICHFLILVWFLVSSLMAWVQLPSIQYFSTEHQILCLANVTRSICLFFIRWPTCLCVWCSSFLWVHVGQSWAQTSCHILSRETTREQEMLVRPELPWPPPSAVFLCDRKLHPLCSSVYGVNNPERKPLTTIATQTASGSGFNSPGVFSLSI